jgi:uncharacterized membrane protein
MKKTFLTLLLVSMAFAASATTVGSENVTVDLEKDTVTVEMFIEELTTETFNYQVNHEMSGVEATFEGKERPCEIERFSIGAEINCETNTSRNLSVKLRYQTEDLVETENNINRFTYTQSIYRPTREYRMRVLLPTGSGLVDPSNLTTPVVQPGDGKKGSLSGRRFFVEWKRNPGLDRNLRFQVAYEELKEKDNSSIIPLILGAVLLLIAAAAAVKRKKGFRSRRQTDDLDADEEMVIDMLKDSGGDMLQKDIVAETDYSKAKISGLVSELEEKDIVNKEKDGRSNRVTLKKDVRK